jgi:hypothetical protein
MMADVLDSLSRELLERLTVEEARPGTTPSTHLVGGIVKAGAKLEALLRETVKRVAAADGVAPESLLTPVGGRPLTLHKAMAGPLAYGLKNHFGSRGARPLVPTLQSIVDDLRAHDSRILGFIKMRNEVAKEGREPRDAHVATKRLHALLSAFRKDAGWD